MFKLNTPTEKNTIEETVLMLEDNRQWLVKDNAYLLPPVSDKGFEYAIVRSSVWNIVKGSYDKGRGATDKSCPTIGGIKSPLGLRPRYIVNHQRQEEILEAVNRYVEADREIPIEWIKEYNELSEKKVK